MKKNKLKLTKDELRQPDIYISITDRIIEKINEYRAICLVVLGVVLFVGVSLFAVDFIKKKREQKASSAFFPIHKEIEKLQKKENDKSQGEESKIVDTKDSQVEFDKLAPLIQQYEASISSHIGTSTAIYGALFLSELYGKYKMWKKANGILSTVSAYIKEGDLFYGLVHTSMGNNSMEIGLFQEAISSYQKVLSSKTHRHLHGHVLIKKGLSHEKLEQLSEAQSIYQQVVKEHPDSPVSQTAKSYLRYLKFKKHYNKISYK